jgi:hypothetical protein
MLNSTPAGTAHAAFPRTGFSVHPDFSPAFRQLAVIIDGLRSRMGLGAVKRFWLFAKTPAIPTQPTFTAAIRSRGGSPFAHLSQSFPG